MFTAYGGGFKSESNCKCPNSQLRAIRFIMVEYDWMDAHLLSELTSGLRQGARVGICLLTGAITPLTDAALQMEESVLSDYIQRALEVEFKCDQCGHIVHKTYEIIKGGGKESAFGRHTKFNSVKKIGDINNRMYEDIEHIFDGMWSNYNFFSRNSLDWTDQMIQRL